MCPKRQKALYLILLCVFSFLFAVSCSFGSNSTAEDTAAYDLAIDIQGTSSFIQVNSQGRLLKPAQISSADGSISLFIDRGTTLQDKSGKPLQSVKIAIDPIIPVPPENAEITSVIVDIQPYEAVILPSIKLTLNYDASLIPQGVNENDVWVYNYAENKWEMLRYKQVDSQARRISTSINRFGKYSVVVPTKPTDKLFYVTQSSLTSITLKEALINGKPTLAEFGRGTCIPCKEMKPILEGLAVEYQDRLNVPIVSVDDYRDFTSYFRVMAIPTQICFDSSGKEIYRHVGFWPKDQIIAQLNKMGIQ